MVIAHSRQIQNLTALLLLVSIGGCGIGGTDFRWRAMDRVKISKLHLFLMPHGWVDIAENPKYKWLGYHISTYILTDKAKIADCVQSLDRLAARGQLEPISGDNVPYDILTALDQDGKRLFSFHFQALPATHKLGPDFEHFMEVICEPINRTL